MNLTERYQLINFPADQILFDNHYMFLSRSERVHELGRTTAVVFMRCSLNQIKYYRAIEVLLSTFRPVQVRGLLVKCACNCVLLVFKRDTYKHVKNELTRLFIFTFLLILILIIPFFQ